jgi:hypothetical protein
MIRTLRVARRSAIKMRTQVANQIHALVVTAPDSLRHQLRDLPLDKLVAVTAAARPGTVTTPSAASKLVLRSLAMRHQGLTAELVVLDRELGRLTMEAAPALCDLTGVGPDVAGRSWWPPATILSASVPTPRSPACAACHRCRFVREDQPTSPQPRWRSHRQQRTLARRHGAPHL